MLFHFYSFRFPLQFICLLYSTFFLAYSFILDIFSFCCFFLHVTIRRIALKCRIEYPNALFCTILELSTMIINVLDLRCYNNMIIISIRASSMLELFYKLELKGVPRLQKVRLRLRLDAPFAFQN